MAALPVAALRVLWRHLLCLNSAWLYRLSQAYLELIQTFQTLLARKRKEVGGLRARYNIGLKQLQTAGEAVVIMQEELTALKPALIQSKQETEEMQVTRHPTPP